MGGEDKTSVSDLQKNKTKQNFLCVTAATNDFYPVLCCSLEYSSVLDPSSPTFMHFFNCLYEI